MVGDLLIKIQEDKIIEPHVAVRVKLREGVAYLSPDHCPS